VRPQSKGLSDVESQFSTKKKYDKFIFREAAWTSWRQKMIWNCPLKSVNTPFVLIPAQITLESQNDAVLNTEASSAPKTVSKMLERGMNIVQSIQELLSAPKTVSKMLERGRNFVLSIWELLSAPKTVSKMLERGRNIALCMEDMLSVPKTVSTMPESRRDTVLCMEDMLSVPKTVSKMLERRGHYVVNTVDPNYALIPALQMLESVS
jgi:hypothetical protein